MTHQNHSYRITVDVRMYWIPSPNSPTEGSILITRSIGDRDDESNFWRSTPLNSGRLLTAGPADDDQVKALTLGLPLHQLDMRSANHRGGSPRIVLKRIEPGSLTDLQRELASTAPRFCLALSSEHIHGEPRKPPNPATGIGLAVGRTHRFSLSTPTGAPRSASMEDGMTKALSRTFGIHTWTRHTPGHHAPTPADARSATALTSPTMSAPPTGHASRSTQLRDMVQASIDLHENSRGVQVGYHNRQINTFVIQAPTTDLNLARTLNRQDVRTAIARLQQSPTDTGRRQTLAHALSSHGQGPSPETFSLQVTPQPQGLLDSLLNGIVAIVASPQGIQVGEHLTQRNYFTYVATRTQGGAALLSSRPDLTAALVDHLVPNGQPPSMSLSKLDAALTDALTTSNINWNDGMDHGRMDAAPLPGQILHIKAHGATVGDHASQTNKLTIKASVTPLETILRAAPSAKTNRPGPERPCPDTVLGAPTADSDLSRPPHPGWRSSRPRPGPEMPGPGPMMPGPGM